MFPKVLSTLLALKKKKRETKTGPLSQMLNSDLLDDFVLTEEDVVPMCIFSDQNKPVEIMTWNSVYWQK